MVTAIVSVTRREFEIMMCLVEGLPNKAISKKLFIAENTVKEHVHSLLKKAGCDNRTQIGVRAAVVIDRISRSDDPNVSQHTKSWSAMLEVKDFIFHRIIEWESDVAVMDTP